MSPDYDYEGTCTSYDCEGTYTSGDIYPVRYYDASNCQDVPKVDDYVRPIVMPKHKVNPRKQYNQPMRKNFAFRRAA